MSKHIWDAEHIREAEEDPAWETCMTCGLRREWHDMSDYPEHDKLAAASVTMQTIREFLYFLTNERAVVFAKWTFDRERPLAMIGDRFPQYAAAVPPYVTTDHPIDNLLDEFFLIDRYELEIEGRMKMDKIRAEHKAKQ